MKNYTVHIDATITTSVKASSEEEAIEKIQAKLELSNELESDLVRSAEFFAEESEE